MARLLSIIIDVGWFLAHVICFPHVLKQTLFYFTVNVLDKIDRLFTINNSASMQVLQLNVNSIIRPVNNIPIHVNSVSNLSILTS